MGCLVSSNKTAPHASVSRSPSNVTTAECAEATNIVQEVVIMNFVHEDQPEYKKVTGKSEVATALAAHEAVTRKVENRKRTGLSSVTKYAFTQTQMGLKNSLSFCAMRSDYPDDSIHGVPPGLQGEPQASLAVSRQQQQQLIPLNTMSCSTRDKEEEMESMETLKTVANIDTGDGDHVGCGEKATREIERKQSQFELLQPEGGKKEDTVQQLFTSEEAFPDPDTSDHYFCHLSPSGTRSPTNAPEFYFSLEDILQQQLPCCPDVIELAAATGTDGGDMRKKSNPLPNPYNFNSPNTDTQLSGGACTTPINYDYYY